MNGEYKEGEESRGKKMNKEEGREGGIWRKVCMMESEDMIGGCRRALWREGKGEGDDRGGYGEGEEYRGKEMRGGRGKGEIIMEEGVHDGI